MRILTSITYYAPYVSGLTVYAQRLAEGLARSGHQVTVLTCAHEQGLPGHETTAGVEVRRFPAWLRLNKGVLMPGHLLAACRGAHAADALHLHLPALEAAPIALYARFLARKPVLVTYHCDIELPRQPLLRAFQPLVRAAHSLTLRLADRVVANSADYAANSSLLKVLGDKFVAVYPPCAFPEGAPARDLGLPEDTPVVGFVGRFAEEKGIDDILAAAAVVGAARPDVVFAFAGEREKVLGEGVYERLRPRFEALGSSARLLGQLTGGDLAAFYRRCDLLLLPSTNSTESFGMVQVEAMMAGTPVVASDRPGIRVPVRATGMGALVRPKQPSELAAAILRLLEKPPPPMSREGLEATFGAEQNLAAYDSLLDELTSVPRPDGAPGGRSRAAATPTTEDFVQRLLLTDATLPRVIVRAAECTLLSEIELPRPLLDVGSGDGTFAAALFDVPVDVGIDPWLEQVRFSRQYESYREIVCAAGAPLPFRDGAFASVLSNSTLEHTPDPEAILREMARVTRPGGVCVITVPNERFPRYLLGTSAFRALRLDAGARAYGRFMNRVSRHVHVYPPERWRAWLADAGFEVVRERRYFSRRNTMALDVSHYLSAPSLLTKAALGRWVLWPGKANHLPLARLLRPFAEPGAEDDGAYSLFVARKGQSRR